MTLSLQFHPAPVMPAALSALTVKNFKQTKSHDGASLAQCDIYIGKTKVGKLFEDDWSGSVMLAGVSEASKETFTDFVKEPAVSAFISEACKDFDPSDTKDITWPLIAIHNAINAVQAYAAIQRKAAKNIMIGEPNRHTCISWTKRTLAQIPAEALQRTIAEGLVSAQKQRIRPTLLNTPEQLKALGVTFTTA